MQISIALTAWSWTANESGWNDTYSRVSSAYLWTDGKCFLTTSNNLDAMEKGLLLTVVTCCTHPVKYDLNHFRNKFTVDAKIWFQNVNQNLMIASVESGAQIYKKKKGYFLFVHVGEYTTLDFKKCRLSWMKLMIGWRVNWKWRIISAMPEKLAGLKFLFTSSSCFFSGLQSD